MKLVIDKCGQFCWMKLLVDKDDKFCRIKLVVNKDEQLGGIKRVVDNNGQLCWMKFLVDNDGQLCWMKFVVKNDEQFCLITLAVDKDDQFCWIERVVNKDEQFCGIKLVDKDEQCCWIKLVVDKAGSRQGWAIMLDKIYSKRGWAILLDKTQNMKSQGSIIGDLEQSGSRMYKVFTLCWLERVCCFKLLVNKIFSFLTKCQVLLVGPFPILGWRSLEALHLGMCGGGHQSFQIRLRHDRAMTLSRNTKYCSKALGVLPLAFPQVIFSNLSLYQVVCLHWSPFGLSLDVNHEFHANF